jgi:hypothetical protein
MAKKMIYINRICRQTGIETVKEFDNKREANRALSGYQMSDKSATYKLSSRATKCWK